MQSRQDGQGIPPYDEETEREIGVLGRGGHGNFEGLRDALDRGVTPDFVVQTKVRAEHGQDGATGSGEAEPASRQRHSPHTETERTRQAIMPDTTEKIREKAYELWILEGRPHGRDLVHWDMARELVAQEEGLDATLLPINPNEEVEDAVAALDNEGESPGLTDQGKDDSDALRVGSPMEETFAVKKKAGRSKM
ncbi:DUF2934 domain-containing protein [Labrys monachus]|uniref:DUF2934 domain-containing protein n=1 Tax=Labrys monachus TaxID=217067 RepID=A0ABU0FBR2_9HYPH|nr:DUF2934 domain-containing protein [Labrys monachus]MDQ0391485.1 hypothetical protein [Labrys monachus]